MTLVSLADRPRNVLTRSVDIPDYLTTRVDIPCGDCVHDHVCGMKATMFPTPIDISIPDSVDTRIRFIIKAEAVCDAKTPLSALEPRTVVAPLTRIDKVRLNLGLLGLVVVLALVIGEGLIRLGAFHL